MLNVHHKIHLIYIVILKVVSWFKKQGKFEIVGFFYSYQQKKNKNIVILWLLETPQKIDLDKEMHLCLIKFRNLKSKVMLVWLI